MATKGVPGTAEQYDAIIAYMVKNFPKEEDTTRLNMNKATADDLVTVIGLTAKEAKALIDFRDKHGEFRQWGDMLVIYGVDGLKVEAAKDEDDVLVSGRRAGGHSLDESDCVGMPNTCRAGGSVSHR